MAPSGNIHTHVSLGWINKVTEQASGRQPVSSIPRSLSASGRVGFSLSDGL